MEKERSLQLLITDYLLEEGRYYSENYPQNIEIINSVPESLNFVMRDPRIVLISEKAYRVDIDRYKEKIHALTGRLDQNGLIELHKNYNAIQEEIVNRNYIISSFLKDYPYLDENGSVIGYYDWIIEGMQQIFTLLNNQTQDYYIGFGIPKVDKEHKIKKSIAESYIEELELETDGQYEGIHDIYHDTDLYLLRKKPKVKVKTLTR